MDKLLGCNADVTRKLIAIRDALMIDDIEEAHHQLYIIANPNCLKFKPWEDLEKLASSKNDLVK